MTTPPVFRIVLVIEVAQPTRMLKAPVMMTQQTMLCKIVMAPGLRVLQLFLMFVVSAMEMAAIVPIELIVTVYTVMLQVTPPSMSWALKIQHFPFLMLTIIAVKYSITAKSAVFQRLITVKAWN